MEPAAGFQLTRLSVLGRHPAFFVIAVDYEIMCSLADEREKVPAAGRGFQSGAIVCQRFSPGAEMKKDLHVLFHGLNGDILKAAVGVFIAG